MQNGSLKFRLNLTTLVFFCIASVLVVVSVNYFQRKYALTVAEEKATILLQHNLAIHSYINRYLKPKIFALTNRVSPPEYFDPTWMSSTYAVRNIDKQYKQNVGSHYYKEAAINARSPENEADDFERDFILRLNKDSGLTKLSVVKNYHGTPYLFTMMRGESMEKECMHCHDGPDKAPADLVKIYGPSRSFNRKVGEVVSAISVRVPLAEAYHEANLVSLKLTAVLLFSIFCAFFLKTWLINRQILSPLENFRNISETIATHPDHLGDVIPMVYTKEINTIAGAFNKMSLQLKHHVDNLDAEVHRQTGELRNSEARYRNLFLNMTNGFALHEMIYDEQGRPVDYRFLEVNPAFEKLTGLSASSLVGRTVKEVMPGIETYWIDTYATVAKKGEPIAYQNYSGELGRYYDAWAFSPEENKFAVVFSDITEQKHLEQMLEHRVQTLTNPLQNSASMTFTDLFSIEEIQKIQDVFAMATGVASIITAPDGKPITSPSNFCDLCLNIIRKTEKGLANCHHSDAVLGRLNPDGPVMQPCLSGGLMDGGTGITVGGHHIANWLVGQVLDESCDLEAMMAYAREIGADEEEYRLALSRVNRMSKAQFDNVCRALYRIAGQLSGMALQNVNQAKYIAERKAAEDALHASERRFREFLENVELMAVTLDINGNITFCNNYLLDRTGWTREEISGKNWFDLFIPERERERLKSAFNSLTTQHHSLMHYENAILTRDGKERLIVWSNTVQHDPEGKVSGIASIGNDVTEHRSTEEQLRQAQKMEAIGLLAGGVAHDFNNILTVISGYCALLQMDSTLNSEQTEQVEQILSASQKAGQLTHGLLAFSRKQALVYKNANLNDIVLHVQKFLTRIIGEDIRLTITIKHPDLTVHVDGTQIEQVLINLATNARDAMPKGGNLSIKTDITEIDQSFASVHEYATPGTYAVLTVSDNGIGMSRDDLPRIFEPFYTTKELGKGTGLGMAITYGIVKQHNGFINVYSEVGVGSTFRIYLPVSERQNSSIEDRNKLESPKGGTETILLAEDEPSVRTLVETILKKYGYGVIVAEDGEEAVQKFSTHREQIRLILMDMIMPKKNGRQAYEEISLMCPGVRVLYSSGYTADFMENRGVSEEGIELIMKPVQPVELLRKVREMLDA